MKTDDNDNVIKTQRYSADESYYEKKIERARLKFKIEDPETRASARMLSILSKEISFLI